eukprot:5075761-Alexandrium_andersonii.AAC.1
MRGSPVARMWYCSMCGAQHSDQSATRCRVCFAPRAVAQRSLQMHSELAPWEKQEHVLRRWPKNKKKNKAKDKGKDGDPDANQLKGPKPIKPPQAIANLFDEAMKPKAKEAGGMGEATVVEVAEVAVRDDKKLQDLVQALREQGEDDMAEQLNKKVGAKDEKGEEAQDGS